MLSKGFIQIKKLGNTAFTEHLEIQRKIFVMYYCTLFLEMNTPNKVECVFNIFQKHPFPNYFTYATMHFLHAFQGFSFFINLPWLQNFFSTKVSNNKNNSKIQKPDNLWK